MKFTIAFLFIAIIFTSFSQTFTIDTDKAVVHFNYLSEETKGEITDVVAKIQLNFEDLSASKIEGVAKVSSLSTGNAARDKHLKTKTYFNVKAFPEMKFSSKSIKAVDGHYEASGQMNIKGFNKPVTFIIEQINGALLLKTSVFADDFGLAIKPGKEASLVEIEITLSEN